MNATVVLNHIKSLKFPKNEYIVGSGAAMAVRGIRKTRDIDMVVSPILFETCKHNDWKIKTFPNGVECLHKDVFELFVSVKHGDYNPSFEYLVQQSDEIDGILFLKLTEVLKFKQAYGREKDLRDIELIQQHLSSIQK